MGPSELARLFRRSPCQHVAEDRPRGPEAHTVVERSQFDGLDIDSKRVLEAAGHAMSISGRSVLLIEDVLLVLVEMPAIVYSLTSQGLDIREVRTRLRTFMEDNGIALHVGDLELQTIVGRLERRGSGASTRFAPSQQQLLDLMLPEPDTVTSEEVNSIIVKRPNSEFSPEDQRRLRCFAVERLRDLIRHKAPTSNEELREVVSNGEEAIAYVIDNFTDERGYKFETYLAWHLRRSL